MILVHLVKLTLVLVTLEVRPTLRVQELAEDSGLGQPLEDFWDTCLVAVLTPTIAPILDGAQAGDLGGGPVILGARVGTLEEQEQSLHLGVGVVHHLVAQVPEQLQDLGAQGEDKS